MFCDIIIRSEQMESRRMAKAMKEPKENPNQHQTNTFQKAKSGLPEEKEKENCDIEEDRTKMSIILTGQTGPGPGVCGPLIKNA